VLSDGDSSRIYRKLVYEDQIALAAFGGGNIIEDPNLFFAVAILQPGRRPEEAEKALIRELDALRNEPITDAELQRSKNQFARDYILGRESNQQKASHLAHAVVIHDDIKTADGEFDIFVNITKEDVQRVARTYFRPENRLVVTIMPGGPGGAREEDLAELIRGASRQGQRPLAPGPWPLASGPSPLASALWPLALGPRSVAPGPWSLASSPWPPASGPRPLASGPWSLASEPRGAR
jgi:hypothetical protein